MFVNIFQSFKEANKEIGDALNYAYPDNKLNVDCGRQALGKIEGVAKSLKIIMANKYDNEEKAEKEEEFRSIYSEFKPTDEQEAVKDSEEEAGYVMHWDALLTAYPDNILQSVDFYKKTGENAMHGALQGITGKVAVMNLVLNAIKVGE